MNQDGILTPELKQKYVDFVAYMKACPDQEIG
jgi:hypothetical protein